MSQQKDQILRLIHRRAASKLANLADEYVHAKPGQKETIQAGIEIERWLCTLCDECPN